MATLTTTESVLYSGPAVSLTLDNTGSVPAWIRWEGRLEQLAPADPPLTIDTQGRTVYGFMKTGTTDVTVASTTAPVSPDTYAELVASLSGTYAPLSVVRASSRKADSWVLVGDSITQRATNKAFWAYARSFLKRRVRLIANAAVGGATSAAQLAIWDASVTTTNAGWVHILVGTNDLDGLSTAAVTAAGTQANISAMLDKADRDGMRAIVGTIIPQTGRTAAMKDAQSQINRWIRALPTTRNVLVADYELAIADPITGDPIADLLNDSTHPGVSGAARMGRVLASVFAPFLVSAPELLNQEADPANVALRGRFSGAGAGAVPTSWFETGASGGARTYSKVARNDSVPGSWQRLVVPSGGAVMLAQNVNIGATLAIGETVNFRVEYKASSLEALTSGQYFFAQIGCYNGSTFTTYEYDIQYGAGNENQIPFDREGMFLTGDLLIPSGTTLVQFGVMIGGGGTYDLDRASLQKV